MKKMFKIMVALFFVLGFANADTIRVGTNGEVLGYALLNNDRVLEGYDIDIWNEIGKRTGKDIKFVLMEFTTLFPLLQDGRIDVVANSIDKSDERDKLYLTSDPYLYIGHVFMSNPKKEIKDIKDMNNWVVGAEQGTSDYDMIKNFEKRNNIELKIKYFDGYSRDQLVIGKVDLILLNEAMVGTAIEQMGKDKIKALVHAGIYNKNIYPFARTKRGQELFELTNKTLKEMRDDGTLKKLSIKWFKADLTDEPK